MGSAVADSHSGSIAGGSHVVALETRCGELWKQGLALNTRRSCAGGQRRFADYSMQSGAAHGSDSVCPAKGWTLCLFAGNISIGLDTALLNQGALPRCVHFTCGGVVLIRCLIV